MEFDLIQRYFYRQAKRPEVVLGNGDDCALLHTNQTLAFSTDTLVEGTHFLKEHISPQDLGYRALAVNLSDLAAMGATPVAFLLSLTLPAPDENWLQLFSQGLFSLADEINCDLIGGNMTKGPLAVTIQIIGKLPPGKALQRNAAKVNDIIFVTGTLGLAPVRPTPRIDFATQLLDLAHAAIDISDGLLQDLNHILEASRLGAEIDLERIPCNDQHAGLYRGEDYELCFTAPAEAAQTIRTLAENRQIRLTPIGRIIQKPGLFESNSQQPIEILGYQHFYAAVLS